MIVRPSPNFLTAALATTGAIALQLILCASSFAATLSQWEFNAVENRLEITVQQGTTPRYFLLENPLRLVIDLPDTEVGSAIAEQSYSGVVQQIRVAQFEPGLTRIVMELSPNIVLSPEQAQLQLLESANGVTRWGIRPLLQGASPAVSSVTPTTNTSTLPPATFWTTNAPQISVPPLSRPSPSMPSQEDAETPGAGAADLVVQPRTFPQRANISTPVRPTPAPPQAVARETIQPPVTVAVPPPAPAQVPVEVSVTRNLPEPSPSPVIVAATQVPVIEFGQPLPRRDFNAGVGGSTVALVALDSRVILPSGTLLTLLYPGTVAMDLRQGAVRQEILLLQEEIRDIDGQIIIPAGATVIGRFEVDRRGSRFITQAINIGDRNFPLAAQSISFSEGSSQTTIQPSQTLQVRLIQDLNRP